MFVTDLLSHNTKGIYWFFEHLPGNIIYNLYVMIVMYITSNQFISPWILQKYSASYGWKDQSYFWFYAKSNYIGFHVLPNIMRPF